MLSLAALWFGKTAKRGVRTQNKRIALPHDLFQFSLQLLQLLSQFLFFHGSKASEQLAGACGQRNKEGTSAGRKVTLSPLKHLTNE